jgi:hypothetical protein
VNKNSILIELSESESIDYAKSPFSSQPIPQKVFWAIWALEAEVNNGGFAQYFFNTSCETVPFVAEALEIIGAPKTAEICRCAIKSAFPNGLPSTPDAISAASVDLSEDIMGKLYEADEEFFRYPHNLTALLFAYVSKHPEIFGTLSKPDDA